MKGRGGVFFPQMDADFRRGFFICVYLCSSADNLLEDDREVEVTHLQCLSAIFSVFPGLRSLGSLHPGLVHYGLSALKVFPRNH